MSNAAERPVVVVIAHASQDWARSVEQHRATAREVVVILRKHGEPLRALAARVLDRVETLRTDGLAVQPMWLHSET